MVRRELKIINRLGLHARASAKLSKLAGDFACEVWLSRGGRRVNGKSILGVMMLAAGQGSVLVLETDGSDEAAAAQALAHLVADRFGEAD